MSLAKENAWQPMNLAPIGPRIEGKRGETIRETWKEHARVGWLYRTSTNELDTWFPESWREIQAERREDAA